jgi:hypothetical protein
MSANPLRRRIDDGSVPVLAVDNRGGGRSDLSADETPEAHERRWAHLQASGWRLTEEGLVLDTSDPRWHKSGRILVPYAEGVPFEEGVRAAYGRQKMIEAQELAREQRERKR